MAAPALAASMADCAICSGVTGTAGLRPGVSAEPVTAHEIMTLRCMPPSLAARPRLQASLARGRGSSPAVLARGNAPHSATCAALRGDATALERRAGIRALLRIPAA